MLIFQADPGDMSILHAKARTYGAYVRALVLAEGMSSGLGRSAVADRCQRGATASSPLLKMGRK